MNGPNGCDLTLAVKFESHMVFENINFTQLERVKTQKKCVVYKLVSSIKEENSRWGRVFLFSFSSSCSS